MARTMCESLARGRATRPAPTATSNLLVRLDAGRSLLDMVATKQDLEDLLGLPVDVVTEAGINPYLREQNLGEEVAP
jgi:uncharacterized protein